MTHPAEEDLILYCFEEGECRDGIAAHLAACARCAAAHRAIVHTLRAVTVSATEPPDRSDAYPAQVWLRVRARLPERPARVTTWRFAPALSPAWLMAAGAVVLLSGAALFLERTWHPQAEAPATASQEKLEDDTDRMRHAAIGDHLEQSERLLLDLVNAEGDTVDVSSYQAVATDLIDAGRLYRDAAADAGDGLIAAVLDDLERSLLDVAHGPSRMTGEELGDVRTRVDAASLLFKIRILANELRERELAAALLRKTI